MTSDKKSQQGTPVENRRRFPRVSIKNDLENAKALVGAELKWISSQVESNSLIFDISYSGAAVERPGALELSKDQELKVQMSLGGLEGFELTARVAWFNEKIVGLQFQEMEHVARMRIDEFLEDKIIGSHMISVSPQYFAEHVDFSYWYHGPNNTNVFLWGPDETKITRAMVSFDGQAMIFEGGEFHRVGGEMEWNVQASYSVETLPKEQSEDLLVILEKDNPLVERSIEILTQLKGLEEPIDRLLQTLLEARS